MAIYDPNLGREHYNTAPEVDISDERETEVTDEIRVIVGEVLDCIDYVCDKLQIPDEKQRKALNYIMDEIIVPGVATVLAEKVKDVLKDELESDIEHLAAEKQQNHTTYSYSGPHSTCGRRAYEKTQ